MIKLHRFTDERKDYWEAWDNGDGNVTVHWGELGTRGQSEVFVSSSFKEVQRVVEQQIAAKRVEGFKELGPDDEFTLLIEYAVNDMGTEADLDKRYRLQDRMNQTLGWTGLGHCDGGSIGSGTMEVCCFVVDFELAKQLIEKDLRETEFVDFTRIFDENA